MLLGRVIASKNCCKNDIHQSVGHRDAKWTQIEEKHGVADTDAS